MSDVQQDGRVVAVVGAGPAGIFAAGELAQQGVRVVLINRDVKPGGLAEYGIYPTKYKMKEGLRDQFRKVLEHPNLAYYGNITIGEQGDLTLKGLQEMGFSAVLITAGAQGTKWLGLPGEGLTGVYHAKDLVYHYNSLPPFSERPFAIGQRAAVIGVGNVMADIAHWLIHDKKIEQVTAVARRGPSDVKFTKKEFQGFARNLDLAAFEAELARLRPMLTAANQDVDKAREFILSALPKADPSDSDTRFGFRFMASPVAMHGNANGHVQALEVEETAFTLRPDGSVKLQGTGQTHLLEVDTVVFAIGDSVDEQLGLPLDYSGFAKNPHPQFPIDEASYEAYDAQKGEALPGIFVAGWSREASSGLVGVARKDGRNGAQAVLNYLATLPPSAANTAEAWQGFVEQLSHPVVEKADWKKLEAAEAEIASGRGLPEYKFASNAEMLALLEAE